MGPCQEAAHPERIQQPEQAGDDRDQQSHLKCQRPSFGIDADNLSLDLRRFVLEDLDELGVAHHFRILLESHSDPLLVGRRQHRAVLGQGGESESERGQHDGARECQPKDNPNDPAAELTPAASLTRSSEIGASV